MDALLTLSLRVRILFQVNTLAGWWFDIFIYSPSMKSFRDDMITSVSKSMILSKLWLIINIMSYWWFCFTCLMQKVEQLIERFFKTPAHNNLFVSTGFSFDLFPVILVGRRGGYFVLLRPKWHTVSILLMSISVGRKATVLVVSEQLTFFTMIKDIWQF